MGVLNHIISPQNIARIFLLLLLINSSSGSPADPTHGFLALPLLNRTHYHIQKPYNLPVSDRYSFKNGIHKLWVYSTDKPLYKTSPTNPRTEFIFNGYNYSSGVWQFEAYGYVPFGTTGVSIMQVFGASTHATTLMLWVVGNGQLSYYNTSVIVSNIYDRWFKLNVIHDVDNSHLKVFIDGILLFMAPGRGGIFHYFKCGVYAQEHDSYFMESRWKAIRIFKKC